MSASGPWWAGRAGPPAPAGGAGGGPPGPTASPLPATALGRLPLAAFAGSTVAVLSACALLGPGIRRFRAAPSLRRSPPWRSRGEDRRLPAAGRRILGLFGLGAVAALLMARALAGLGGVPAGLASNEAEGRVVVR